MGDEQIREWAEEIEDDRRVEHRLVWKALAALAIVAAVARAGPLSRQL